MLGWRADFAPSLTRANLDLKTCLHRWMEWGIFLKMASSRIWTNTWWQWLHWNKESKLGPEAGEWTRIRGSYYGVWVKLWSLIYLSKLTKTRFSFYFDMLICITICMQDGLADVQWKVCRLYLVVGLVVSLHTLSTGTVRVKSKACPDRNKSGDGTKVGTGHLKLIGKSSYLFSYTKPVLIVYGHEWLNYNCHGATGQYSRYI
jgi:hypothetical protein